MSPLIRPVATFSPEGEKDLMGVLCAAVAAVFHRFTRRTF